MINNSVTRLFHRQKNSSIHSFQRQSYVTPDTINRLGLETELTGHSGCVNCIKWNDSGRILASGSDDQKVILWDPFIRTKLHMFRTGHRNNIFSIQFVPNSGDRLLLSCAGDHTVRLHDVSRTNVQIYACHSARIKRLAVTRAEPHLFWTAGEDGLVLQYDLRTPPKCVDECEHALINLNHHCGLEAEVKSVAISPTWPELLAVGSNDPFVRLFDRRMLTTGRVALRNASSPINADVSLQGQCYDFPEHAAQYFSPGAKSSHLPLIHGDYRRRLRQLVVTNLAFSPNGAELLVNLGGEQIYLFDVATGGRKMTILAELNAALQRVTVNKPSSSSSLTNTNGYHQSSTNGVSTSKFLLQSGVDSGPELSSGAELLKRRANEFLKRKRYSEAIACYGEALLIDPDAAILYSNRAAAYMRRTWDGDSYAALRDCYQTLIRQPAHLKALFRLARCFFDLKMLDQSAQCLQLFKTYYPNEAESSTAFQSLNKDTQNGISARKDSETNGQRRPGTRRSLMRRRRTNTEENLEVVEVDNDAESNNESRVSSSELDRRLRQCANDYKLRYCGHCNTTTDIKEANFLGGNGEYIVAGSDDGSFVIWEHDSCTVVSVLRGDESIVNCLQPHPSMCMLATSGIENVIRLWTPRQENGHENDRLVEDVDTAALANQRRMNTDPLEVMLSNIGYHFDVPADSSEGATVQCRPS